MAKDKTKRTSKPAGRPLLPGWWRGLSSDSRRRLLFAVLHVLMIAGMLGGVAYGLWTASDYVRGLDRYQGPIDIALRIKHRKDDVLVVLRDVPEINLPAKAQVIYRQTDRATGLLIVDFNGKTVQVASDDVAPEWLGQFAGVSSQLVRQANAIANALPTASSRSPDWFDPKTAHKIREAAAGDAFVEKVVQVDKQLLPPEGNSDRFRRQVVLTVVLRRPVAQVWYPPPGTSRIEPYCYLLDRNGVVLDKRKSAADGLPYVVGFVLSRQQAAEQLRPGVRLASPDVQAGLNLLARLSNRPFFNELSQVDVANYARRLAGGASELVLWTHSTQTLKPQEIWWGLRDDNPAVEYNNTLEKMQILQNIWATHGRLNVQDRYPGPYSLYHTRGLPFQPNTETTTTPRSSRSADGHGRS